MFKFTSEFEGTETTTVPSVNYYGIPNKIGTPSAIEVSEAKAYRGVQLHTLWDDLEEIWNMIGFANVNGKIYINRMSDVALLERPMWFHPNVYKHPLFGSWDYPHLFKVYKSVLKMFQKAPDVLLPEQKAWDILMQLHERKGVVEYIMGMGQDLERLLETLEGVELLNPLPEEKI